MGGRDSWAGRPMGAHPALLGVPPSWCRQTRQAGPYTSALPARRVVITVWLTAPQLVIVSVDVSWQLAEMSSWAGLVLS